MHVTSFRLSLAVALTACTLAVAQQHAVNVLTLTSPVTDAILLADGTVRLYTQDFTVYDASAPKQAWTRRAATTHGVIAKKLGRLYVRNNIVLAFGAFIDSASGTSVVLRSTDDGVTFTGVKFVNDSLGTTDGCNVASDGTLTFVDRAGRLFKSSDAGSSWSKIQLPTVIPSVGLKEATMLDANVGVAVDAQRKVYYTTNGWQSCVSPVAANKPITRSQPSLQQLFFWDSEFYVLNNILVFREFRDVYRTTSSSLIWERWDSIACFAVSADQRFMAYTFVDGRLILEDVQTGEKTVLDTVSLQPQFIRISGKSLITYRADTGPIVYNGGTKTMIRPVDSEATTTKPTLITASGEFGILASSTDAVMVDIVRKGKGHSWLYDTTLNVGIARNIRTKGDNVLLIDNEYTTLKYDSKKRTVEMYNLEAPLEQLRQAPLRKLRITLTTIASTGIRKKWCEYKLSANHLACTEVVDSSSDGISSHLFRNTIPQDTVTAILNAINAVGSQLPAIADFVPGDSLRSSYAVMLDTIFRYDNYFNVHQAYMTPPLPEVQAKACSTEFMARLDEISQLTPQMIMRGVRQYRRVSHYPRYVYSVSFENTSGRTAVFETDAIEESHAPLMLPWTGTSDANRWMSYCSRLPQLVASYMPVWILPGVYTEMLRPEWLYLAVAAYQDGLVRGRWHSWAGGVVSPMTLKK